MPARRMHIGVFDSGFGGLTVLRGITSLLPQYSYIYLADTARAPYGGRASKTIYKFTEEAVNFLFKQGCQLIILACNTASSDALHRIQKDYLPKNYPDRRVLGVLIPAAEEAKDSTRTKKVGIMATESTVASKTFVEELAKLEPEIKVFQQACPMLVPFVEAGEHKSPAAELMLKKYLETLLRYKPDTIILGCTHYGHFEYKIKKLISPQIRLVNEERVVPKKLWDYLGRHPEIESKLALEASQRFFSTDIPMRFEKLGRLFYGKPLKIQQVSLD